MMEITSTERTQFDEIRYFYHSLIDAMKGYSFNTCWEKDVYPSASFLQNAVESGNLYVGRSGGRIAAAMVLNHECNPEYNEAKWNINISESDFMVIHALGVHPDFSGKGCGKAMVERAIEIGRSYNLKAIRLDVLDGNIYAEKLYTSCGFIYVDTLELYYEDTGKTKFNLFERLL